MTTDHIIPRSLVTRGRPFTLGELIADGIVHGVGIFVAIALGAAPSSPMRRSKRRRTRPPRWFCMWRRCCSSSASPAFNLCPVTAPAKRTLARLDQAAIFLFIAGTYTPFLVLLGATPPGIILGLLIWGAALTGMALKLFVPHRFGR